MFVKKSVKMHSEEEGHFALRKIVAFVAQKTCTHILKSRRAQNEPLFDVDFVPEA